MGDISGISEAELQSDLPSLPVPNPTISFWHMSHPNDLVKHRTTTTLPKSASVVIIGSGISGAFAARELIIKEGLKDVVVLEARDVCSGATGRNGGHCQPLLYDSAPETAEFELANFEFLRGHIKDSKIPCDFFQFNHGGCHAYYSQELFDEVKGKIAKLGNSFPHIANQVKVIEEEERLEALRIPQAVGAVIQANASGLHPYKLVTWTWKELLKKGGLNLQTGTPVTDIWPGDGDKWIVKTPRGEVEADQVLFTTNGYTAHLLPEFEALIVPVQGEMSAMKPTRAVLESPLQHDYSFLGLMEQDHFEDDYLVQRPIEVGGHLMFGGGRMVASGAAVNVSDDSFVDKGVALYLRRMLPRLISVRSAGEEEDLKRPDRWADAEREGAGRDMVPEAEWTGIMGYSRDGHPWVGEVPGKQGVWVCGGYTGHGMPNASLSAAHAARLIATVANGKDWRAVEKEAVESKMIPESYVLTEERMSRARRLPRIHGTHDPRSSVA